MKEIKKNIILVGFMGSGKTTVGKLLADYLKFKFVDLDYQIEKNNGLLISDIFHKLGEKQFRDLEKKEIQNLKNTRDTVISLGGGTFCSEENIKILKEIGFTIYLKADYSILINRYTETEIIKRPLLQESGKVQDLLKTREGFYSRADFIIETDNLKPGEIKDSIIGYILESNI